MSRRLIAAVTCLIGITGCTEERTYFQCEACFTGPPLPGVCARSADSPSPYVHGDSDESNERTSIIHDLCMMWDKSLSPEARAATGVKEELTAETRASLGVSELYDYCASAIDDKKWPVKVSCKPKVVRLPVPLFGWK